MRKNRPNYSSAAKRLRSLRTGQRKKLVQAQLAVDVGKLAERVLLNAVNAPLDVRAGAGFTYQELPEIETTENDPYGILPELVTATPEELIEAADKLAAAKYEYTRRGDYHAAWKAGWRERLIEKVLQGTARVGIRPAGG